MVAVRWMNVVCGEPVAVGAGGRRHAVDSSSHGIAVGSTVTPSTRCAANGAAVLGLPRRPAEVVDDELAVVVVQVGARCDEGPGEPFVLGLQV